MLALSLVVTCFFPRGGWGVSSRKLRLGCADHVPKSLEYPNKTKICGFPYPRPVYDLTKITRFPAPATNFIFLCTYHYVNLCKVAMK